MVRAMLNSRGADSDFETDVMEVLLADQWENVERTQTVIGYRVFDPDDSFVE